MVSVDGLVCGCCLLNAVCWLLVSVVGVGCWLFVIFDLLLTVYVLCRGLVIGCTIVGCSLLVVGIARWSLAIRG